MLKNGPANIPDVIENHSGSYKWSDIDFNGKNTLYSRFTD